MLYDIELNDCSYYLNNYNLMSLKIKNYNSEKRLDRYC